MDHKLKLDNREMDHKPKLSFMLISLFSLMDHMYLCTINQIKQHNLKIIMEKDTKICKHLYSIMLIHSAFTLSTSAADS